MLKQATQLALDIGMFQSRRRSHHVVKNKSFNMQRVTARTALGILFLNACVPQCIKRFGVEADRLIRQMSLEMGSSTDLTLSDSRPYPIDDVDENTMWIPYPLTNRLSFDEKPAPHRYVMAELVYLTEIMDDINCLLLDKAYDMEVDDLWLATNRIYSRIRIRLECLPDALRIEDEPVPQALFVR